MDQNTISILRPDDMHLHLRDGPYLEAVLPHTTARFGRAIVMPNLKPPVLTVQDAAAYRERILKAASPAVFEPLMTLYLTESTTAAEIRSARGSGFIHGIKLYPAGATTHSDAGVRNTRNIYPLCEVMQAEQMPLLVHAESTRPDVDVFDREAVFLEEELAPLVQQFPDLKLVLEHVTTKIGLNFVRAHKDRVAATITAHHLLINRNAIFTGGLRPHHYCLPVAKTEADRLALLQAATSGETCFFLGTDSAPHSRQTKESRCCPAGIYTAHAGIELYALAFEQAGLKGSVLEQRLEQFASRNGCAFYGLPLAKDRITLVREEWPLPESYPFAREELIPFRAGELLHWKLSATNAVATAPAPAPVQPA